MKEKVASAIETMRPMLQNDGGDITLIDVDEETGVVKVALQGACSCCPHAAQTLKLGVEAKLKEEVPEVREVVAQQPG